MSTDGIKHLCGVFFWGGLGFLLLVGTCGWP